MKGITPVIAIILLLLITISMVGFAFVWFSRVTQSATTSGSQQMTTMTSNANKRISIESVVAGRAYVRISGSANIATTEISTYLCGGANCPLTLDSTANAWKDTAGNCAANAVSPLASGTLYCYSAAAVACPGKIRIQAPGGFDETTC